MICHGSSIGTKSRQRRWPPTSGRQRRALVIAGWIASSNVACQAFYPLDDLSSSNAGAGGGQDGAPSMAQPPATGAGGQGGAPFVMQPPANSGATPTQPRADAGAAAATADASVAAPMADACNGFPSTGDGALLLADAEGSSDDNLRARVTLLPAPSMERGLWFPPQAQVAQQAEGCPNHFVEVSVGPEQGFGFNFRSGYAGGYVDLSAYRGVRFWALSTIGGVEMTVELVDAPYDGDCCAAQPSGLVRCVDIGAGCQLEPGLTAGDVCSTDDFTPPRECFEARASTTLTWTEEWQEFTIEFQDFDPPSGAAGLSTSVTLEYMRSVRFASPVQNRLQVDQLELLRTVDAP